MPRIAVGEWYEVHSRFQYEGREFIPGHTFETIGEKYAGAHENQRVLACQFTHEFDGHTCEGIGENGRCWWIRERLLLMHTQGRYVEPAWEL